MTTTRYKFNKKLFKPSAFFKTVNKGNFVLNYVILSFLDNTFHIRSTESLSKLLEKFVKFNKRFFILITKPLMCTR